MNLNIIAYIIYLTLTITVVAKVGWVCYSNGNIFIQSILNENIRFAKHVNKLLLIGYCLLNIGYCAMTLISWSQIESLLVLIEVVSIKISSILLIIAALHYINIYVIKNYLHKLL